MDNHTTVSTDPLTFPGFVPVKNSEGKIIGFKPESEVNNEVTLHEAKALFVEPEKQTEQEESQPEVKETLAEKINKESEAQRSKTRGQTEGITTVDELSFTDGTSDKPSWLGEPAIKPAINCKPLPKGLQIEVKPKNSSLTDMTEAEKDLKCIAEDRNNIAKSLEAIDKDIDRVCGRHSELGKETREYISNLINTDPAVLTAVLKESSLNASKKMSESPATKEFLKQIKADPLALMLYQELNGPSRISILQDDIEKYKDLLQQYDAMLESSFIADMSERVKDIILNRKIAIENFLYTLKEELKLRNESNPFYLKDITLLKDKLPNQ